jgi:hypothetical protein
MPGVFGRGVASIGGAANMLLKGKSMNAGVDAARLGIASAPRGSRRAAVSSFRDAERLRSESNMKTGRRVIGAGIGMTGIGMANRGGSGSRGGYQPRRPVIPVQQNGMRM